MSPREWWRIVRDAEPVTVATHAPQADSRNRPEIKSVARGAGGRIPSNYNTNRDGTAPAFYWLSSSALSRTGRKACAKT
jgi:hypothetical protein